MKVVCSQHKGFVMKERPATRPLNTMKARGIGLVVPGMGVSHPMSG